MAPGDDGHLVELQNRLATERNRLAELRQLVEQAASRSTTLKGASCPLPAEAADQAELVADQAESFAAQLEAMAVGADRERRLKLAQRERVIAAVERRRYRLVPVLYRLRPVSA